MTTPEPSAQPDRVGELIALVMKLSGDLAEVSARLGEQETATAEFHDVFDWIEDQRLAAEADAAADTEPDAETDEHDEPPAPLDLRALIAWFRENVAVVLERKIPQSSAPNWCRSWWLHPEALVRFQGAYESWLEATTSSGNAKVVYFEHLDHQLGVLMAPDGPFASCTLDKHREGPLEQRLLGHVEPGEEYFVAFERAHEQLEQTQPLAQASTHGGRPHPTGGGPSPAPTTAPVAGPHGMPGHGIGPAQRGGNGGRSR